MAGPLTTYAAARGLRVAAGGELPPVTPLLGRRGRVS